MKALAKRQLRRPVQAHRYRRCPEDRTHPTAGRRARSPRSSRSWSGRDRDPIPEPASHRPDLGRAEQNLLHALIDRLEFRRRDTDPEGQRGAIDRQALQLHDLRLAIERIVPSEFVDHDAGHETFSRNTALDQTLGCRCLDDRALAGPAAIFGTMRNDYLVLSWDLVQTLRALFPNDMHRAVAARASRALRFDRDMNMRKMRRQRTAVDASLLTLIRWFVGCAILLRLFRISVGKCGLDIFQCQLHLIAIKLFGPL